ncbi:hypothetical protein STEG23_038228, partial [Scotinomys teguina]
EANVLVLDTILLGRLSLIVGSISLKVFFGVISHFIHLSGSSDSSTQIHLSPSVQVILLSVHSHSI